MDMLRNEVRQLNPEQYTETKALEHASQSRRIDTPQKLKRPAIRRGRCRRRGLADVGWSLILRLGKVIVFELMRQRLGEFDSLIARLTVARVGQGWATSEKFGDDAFLFARFDLVHLHDGIAHAGSLVGTHLVEQRIRRPLVERRDQNGCFSQCGR